MMYPDGPDYQLQKGKQTMATHTNMQDQREELYRANAHKPTNMHELIQQQSLVTVKETKLTPQMVHQFAEDAEHYGALATSISAAPYRMSTEHVPFTPVQAQTLALAANILRTKGVELGDAMAAGIVRRAVPRTE